MYLKTALEIIISLLAVFGLYSLVRLTVQKIFSPANYILTIEILTPEDASNADLLIRSALTQFLAVGRGRVAVMVSSDFADDGTLMDTIDKYGVDCYIVGD
ncbi:MAG: hypothetical protein ACI3XQ_05165 [Eubacteriales bacterium]